MADKTQPEIENAPDPEEDDLDDLDDVLDAFDSKPQLPSEPKPTATGPGRPDAPPPTSLSPPQTLPLRPKPGAEDATATTAKEAEETEKEEGGSGEGEEEEEDLAAQLQAGMGNLISELGENPEMQRQFEAMMQELIGASSSSGGGGAGAPQAATESAKAKEAPDATARKAAAAAGAAAGKREATNFQDTILKTMERMQQSGDAATAAASSSEKPQTEEEMLMEMLKSIGGEGGDGGPGDEESFNQMLLNMMTQLVHKEILYEPMKELDTKFPAWMEKNKDNAAVSKEDWKRYQEQRRLVGEIVGRFERSGYSDEDVGDREFIVERMQKMQEAGSPPPDLVGDMSAAQEALGEMDQGCPTQ